MMIWILIVVALLVVGAVVVVVLKKKSDGKPSRGEVPEEVIADLPVDELEEVQETKDAAAEDVEDTSEVQEDLAAFLESAVDDQQEKAEVAEPVAKPEPEPESEPELELSIEAEPEPKSTTVSAPEPEPEPVSIPDPEPEPKPEPEPELEPEPEPIPEPKPELVVEEEEPTVEATIDDQSDVTVTLASYEQRMVALKEKRAAALATAIEKNDEKKREQLQIVVVHVTEALTFPQQNYQKEIACRNEALDALEQIRPEIDDAAYEQARTSLCDSGTAAAEQVFDSIAVKGVPLSALAAYQSGRLAECRMEFVRALSRLEKALSLEQTNPDYLRASGLLTRKLYRHKQALARFVALEKIIAAKGEDSLELALVRRDLAHTVALAGRNKQAGPIYKKAMISLSKLVGGNDREMGICWFQIGVLQESMGEYEKAEAQYKKALAIIDKTGDEVVLSEILQKLASLNMELEEDREAIPLLERLCAIKEKPAHPDQAGLIIIYNGLAEALRVSGKYEESEEIFKKTLAITQELRGKDHPAVGSIYQELAKVCDRQRKKEEAQDYQKRASAIFQRVMEEQLAAEGESQGNLTL